VLFTGKLQQILIDCFIETYVFVNIPLTYEEISLSTYFCGRNGLFWWL